MARLPRQDNCSLLTNGLLPGSSGGPASNTPHIRAGRRQPKQNLLPGPLFSSHNRGNRHQGRTTPNVPSPTRQACPWLDSSHGLPTSSVVGSQRVSKSTCTAACTSSLQSQPRHAYCCGATLPLSADASGPGVLAAAFLAARVARLLATAGDIDPDAQRAFIQSARVHNEGRNSPEDGERAQRCGGSLPFME